MPTKPRPDQPTTQKVPTTPPLTWSPFRCSISTPVSSVANSAQHENMMTQALAPVMKVIFRTGSQCSASMSMYDNFSEPACLK